MGLEKKNIPDRIYPSKILLFGEYTVLLGSSALAIPFDKMYGRWKYDPSKKNDLQNFYDYLLDQDWEELGVELKRSQMKEAMYDHVIYRSNIKPGYGLGSSGALTAAVFDRFFKTDSINGKAMLKKVFSMMENFFHGSSSGIDPLVSYCNKALLLQQQKVEEISIDLLGCFHLIDSGKKRTTQKMVNHFKQKINLDINKLTLSQLALSTDYAIQALLKKDVKLLVDHSQKISDCQQALFDYMIPKKIKSLMLSENKGVAIKLLGAGGGGYFLRIGDNLELEKLVDKDYIAL